jgi:hypothetical protein
LAETTSLPFLQQISEGGRAFDRKKINPPPSYVQAYNSITRLNSINVSFLFLAVLSLPFVLIPKLHASWEALGGLETSKKRQMSGATKAGISARALVYVDCHRTSSNSVGTSPAQLSF